MTNKEKMGQFYERMAAKHQKYKERLLERLPNVILDNTCKFTIRKAIVVGMEAPKLTDEHIAALLCSHTPMTDVYRAWSKTETMHIDDVRDMIEDRANKIFILCAKGRCV